MWCCRGGARPGRGQAWGWCGAALQGGANGLLGFWHGHAYIKIGGKREGGTGERRKRKREGRTRVMEVVGDVGAVGRRSGERGEEEEGVGRVLARGEEDEEAYG